MYRLGGIFGSVGHRVKIHKITPATGKERDDLDIKNYVVLQKSQEQDDRLPPPRTLILDFTFTHTRYGSSHVHTTGQLTNTRRSDGTPELDGTLREVDRKKILHYRQLYINRPDPISSLPAVVDTRLCAWSWFSAQNAKEIDEILDLTFDHWCLVRTRIPSRSHPGISRTRGTGGVEEDVHNMLSAQDRAQEVDDHLHVNVDNTGTGQRQDTMCVVRVIR